ncbi:MAG: secretin N-terminal domain-containing protein [Pirellulales bacterium]
MLEVQPGHGTIRKVLLGAFCAGAFAVSAAWAQDTVIRSAAPAGVVQAVGPDGKPMVVKGGPAGAQPAGAQPGQKPGETKPGEQKPGAQKPGEQKPGEGGVTQRPTKPDKPANPEELKVRPDAEGKVRFNFTGQPWPAVLEWVATISGMSLDWQELPGDFLNLTTRQAYTVDQARGLINRHLFARGFTMLENDDVLTVVNIKKIDPGMVPRVSPDELAKRNPYDFVKVSFPLDWMIAETTAEELKPLISPSGKLNALKSTNRLEVMDVVMNLRDIHQVLREEQSSGVEEQLVREFPLQHARASDVVEQLSALLGVESKGGPKTPLTPQEMQMQQQQAQMRMQMQQQQQQQGGPPKPGPKEEASINLVVNTRKNSVLASAPPDKMKIIEQAVKVLDVESQGAENLLANLNRMQVYKLSELEPETFAKMLTDMGLLDPITTVQVDKRNKSIVVFATLSDHLMISQLLKKLDRTGRTFEVIPLRRLEADSVAGTVEFMINGGSKDDQQQRRPSYYGFGYYMQNQEEEKSTDKFRVDADVENNQLILWANPVEMEQVYNLLAKLGEVPMRGGNTSTVRVLNVEPGEDTAQALERLRRAWPNVAPNPLLMPDTGILNGTKGTSNGETEGTGRRASRASQNEEARSNKSNRKDRTSQSDGLTVVPIDHRTATELDEPLPTAAVIAVPAVLRKTAQKSAADEPRPVNESKAAPDLEASDPVIEKPTDSAPTAAKDDDQNDTRNASSEQESEKRTNGVLSDDQAPNDRAATRRDALRQRALGQPELGQRANGLRGPANGGRVAAAEPPPVNVSVGPNGELIITSPDTQALDLFEEMVNQVAPPRREFKVFHLKHASAFSVAFNLEDYFQLDKKKDDSNQRYPYYYFYDDYGSQKKDDKRRLSKRRELTFIDDIDTNSILVTGADPSQLKIIEELIEIYDRIEPPDSRMARMTKIFTLRYSKAKIVGEAVKDVYRDLLSTNDKALQGDQNKKDNKRAENVYIFGGEGEEDPRSTAVKFKGKLSVGIDELSNTLVVSTEGENLMNNVAQMIESLDAAARPALSRVHVMQVNGTMSSGDVRKALARALIEQQRAQAQQPGAQQPGQNGQQPQQNGQGQSFQQNGQNPQE